MLFDGAGEPKDVAIACQYNEAQSNTENDNSPGSERTTDTHGAVLAFSVRFARKFGTQPVSLIRAEPLSLAWAVSDAEGCDAAKNDSGQPLQDEDPAPA